MTFRASLQSQMFPTSLVVVGASERFGSLGARLWEAARSGSRMDPLIAVNPKYDTLSVAPCLRDIHELTHSVDAALISISATKARSALEHLARQHCKLAVLAADATPDWFSEESLTLMAKLPAQGMRLLGPGAWGILHPGQRINLSRFRELPKPGSIALITQTGPLAALVMEDMRETELGFSVVAATGAEMDLEESDFIEQYAADKNTRVIAVEIARVRNPRRLFSALLAASRRKRVVVFASHFPESTHRLLSTVLKQANVWLAKSTDEFCSTIAALATNRLPKGAQLTVLLAGGDPGAWIVDRVRSEGATLARLSARTMAELHTAKISTSVSNPIVLATTAELALKALPIVLDDPQTDAVLLVVTPDGAGASPFTITQLIKHITGSQKPILGVWLSDRATREIRTALAEHLNVPLSVHSTVENAMRVFSALVAQSTQRRQRHDLSIDRPERADKKGIAAMRALTVAAQQTGHLTLELPQSRAFIEHLGLNNAPVWVAQNATQVAEQATRLGWPLWVQPRAHGLEEALEGQAIYNEEELNCFVERATTLLNDMRLSDCSPALLTLKYRAGFADPLKVVLARDALMGPCITLSRPTQTRTGLLGTTSQPLLLAVPFRYRELWHELYASSLLYREEKTESILLQLAEILCKLSDAAASIPALWRVSLNLLHLDGAWSARDAIVRVSTDAVKPERGYPHLLLPPPPLELSKIITTPRGSVTLRPLLDGDGAALRAHLGRLSERSLYLRFHTRARLTEERVAQVYDQDPISESTWVVEQAGELRGLANWHRISGTSQAEFGIAIEDGWHRMGLARALMGELIESARVRGISTLIGYVLKGNDAMQAMMRALSFSKCPDTSPDTETWVLEISYNAAHEQ